MKIIAREGTSRFLVDLQTEVDGKPQGQIFDTSKGRAYPPMLIDSLRARGYWEDFDATPEATSTILNACVGPVVR